MESKASTMPSDEEWVEIQWQVLDAGERAANLPVDTRATPYVARVRGLARTPAGIGSASEVITVTGRVVHGELVAVRPGYTHTFGRPTQPWLAMREAIRAELAAIRGGLSA